jgi:hypothetical protein
MQGTWRNMLAQEFLVEDYKMPFIPIYNSSATAWQFHRRNHDGQECSHYCHPSIPQLWVWVLKQTLQQHGTKPVEEYQEVKRHKPGCATVLDYNEQYFERPKSVDVGLKQQRLHRQMARLGTKQGVVLDLEPEPLPVQALQVNDGVFPVNAATDGASTGSSSSTLSGETLHPWQALDKVLNKKQQQQQQQQVVQQRHQQHRRQLHA